MSTAGHFHPDDLEEIVYTAPDTGDGGLLRVATPRLLKGMFVADLDRPWSDTPLPRGGLLVDSEQELEALRTHCRHVMVDPALSSEELVPAIRAAAVLSNDQDLTLDSGTDDWPDRHAAGRPRAASARRAPLPDYAAPAAPRPRDDVHPSEAARARVLRLVRDRVQAPNAEAGALSQVRRWFGMGRRPEPDPDPDTLTMRGEQTLQALRDAWGELLGVQEYGEGAPLRESIGQARPVHARLVTAADHAVQQVRKGTPLELGPLAEAARLFAATLADAPDALRWLDAVHAHSAAAPNHAVGVALRLGEFGRALGMPRDALFDLVVVGLLLDVGKTLLPRELLEHPGVLKPQDFALMKQHVAIGLDILSQAGGVPDAVVRGVAEHHERLDGSGYPRGLRGDAVGLYGRMAGIVDTFCALTAARAYANPLSAEDAMSALHEWSGKLFCPRLVEQFIVAHGAYPIGSLVELQSGEVAAVVDRQPGNRLQPKLVIMTGPDKGPVRALAEAATRNPDGTPKRIAVRVARSLPAGAFGLRLKDYYLAPG